MQSLWCRRPPAKCLLVSCQSTLSQILWQATPCKEPHNLSHCHAQNDNCTYLPSSLAPKCVQLDTTGKSGAMPALKKPLCQRLKSAPATLPMLRSNVNTGLSRNILFMLCLALAFCTEPCLPASIRVEQEFCLGLKLLVEWWHNCIAR